MIVTLTGTPGTGKTSVSKELADFRTINLTAFVKDMELGNEGQDEFEVDVGAMVEALSEEVSEDEDVLIEGHLSHHFPSDFCIVLRCNPEILRERLSKRDYSDEKIEENVESEILDVVLAEAAETQDDIIEIDTSEITASETAAEIKSNIENKETGFGNVDWTEFLDV